MLATFGIVYIIIIYFFGTLAKDVNKSFSSISNIFLFFAVVLGFPISPSVFIFQSANYIKANFWLQLFLNFDIFIQFQGNLGLDLFETSSFELNPILFYNYSYVNFIFFFNLVIYASLISFCDSKRLNSYKLKRSQPKVRPTSNILEANCITKSFEKDKSTLNGVSFSLKPGEIIGVLGPNGTGKSTLFKILAFEIPRSNGELTILS